MLAALRPYVAYDKVKRRMVWDGGYNAVVEAWEKLGGTMMQSCAETSQSLGGANNQNATGKHRPLSGGLTSTEIKASVKTILPQAAARRSAAVGRRRGDRDGSRRPARQRLLSCGRDEPVPTIRGDGLAGPPPRRRRDGHA